MWCVQKLDHLAPEPRAVALHRHCAIETPATRAAGAPTTIHSRHGADMVVYGWSRYAEAYKPSPPTPQRVGGARR